MLVGSNLRTIRFLVWTQGPPIYFLLRSSVNSDGVILGDDGSPCRSAKEGAMATDEGREHRQELVVKEKLAKQDARERSTAPRSVRRRPSRLEPEGTARTSGFSKTTTLRLVKTLEALEYLACDPSTGRYYLGSSILRHAYVGLSHSELARTAHPFLLELADETTETAGLTVWTNQGPLLVDLVLTSRMFKPHLWLGMLLPGREAPRRESIWPSGPRAFARRSSAALRSRGRPSR